MKSLTPTCFLTRFYFMKQRYISTQRSNLPMRYPVALQLNDDVSQLA